MNRRELLGAGLLVLTGSGLGLVTAPASEPVPQDILRERMLGTAREIMNAARFCALITLDESGRAEARTMDPFPPEEDLTVWFGTNARSRKVSQIRRDPRVTLYYFDPQSQGYVTLFGSARLVNDPKEKKARWKDAWAGFYPDRDKDYILITVTPERLEVVSPKHGIVNSGADWLPPSIRLAPLRP